MGGLAVPAGPSRFLVVAFQILGQIAVKDITDIRFIDTHPESDGGDHDVHLIPVECVLVDRPGFIIQAGMVRERPDVLCREHLRGFFNIFAGGPVDDARFTGTGPDKFQDLGGGFLLGRHFIEQIRAVKRCADQER